MDFLTFKSFISTEVLIVFYYIGAIIIPVAAWYFAHWLIQKYGMINIAYEKGRDSIWGSLSMKQRRRLTIFFITCFLFVELFWRMLFEFLIAYMQIRDALLLAPAR